MSQIYPDPPTPGEGARSQPEARGIPFSVPSSMTLPVSLRIIVDELIRHSSAEEPSSSFRATTSSRTTDRPRPARCELILLSTERGSNMSQVVFTQLQAEAMMNPCSRATREALRRRWEQYVGSISAASAAPSAVADGHRIPLSDTERVPELEDG